MTEARGTRPAHAGFDPPLRIDWIEASQLRDGRRGRLGLTFLPGKRGASERYPGHVFERDLASDLEALRERRVALFVLLVEDHELERWSDPAIAERAGAASVRLLRVPIPDGGAPPDMATMDRILDAIGTARDRGDAVVACLGGVGRTGTVAACALVAAGETPADAIAHVRSVRHPEAVETPEQEEFVAAYAAHRSGAG